MLDWQYFVLRPEIKKLPLMEQKRKFLAYQLNYDRRLTEAIYQQQQLLAQSNSSVGGGKFPDKTPPPDPYFKLTIDTTQAGVSDNQTFQLTLQNGPTNLTVDWGDGSSDLITTYNQSELTHSYASSGTYQLSLSGGFEGLISNTGNPSSFNSDRYKIMSIDNWGIIQWKNMDFAFFACINMVGNYKDQPDTSLVTSMRNTFSACL